MESQDLITIIFSFCRNNAGWLFSGIGVSLLGFIIKKVLSRKKKTTIHQEANSNKQSKITQVGGHYERH